MPVRFPSPRTLFFLVFCLSFTLASRAAAQEPAIQASNLSVTVGLCNQLDLTWTNGDGAERIVIARSGNAVNQAPADGNQYNASSVFGSGDNLGLGNFVVYAGSGNSFSVTGLTGGQTYHFAVFEYNGSGGGTDYLLSGAPTGSETATGASVNVSANDPTLCAGQSATLTASGGLNYAWSPASGLSATTGNPVTATPSVTTTYTVVGIDINGCRDTAYQALTVFPLPTVSLGAFSAVCANAPAFTLTGGTPAGGTYSGLGVSSGSFNPASVGAGNYAIQYTYTDGNGCSASASSSITVNPAPTVTIGSFSPVCANSSPFALTGGSPVGGTYSGPGVSSGIFNPAVAGTGNAVITYTYTNAFNCVASDTSVIVVSAAPTVSFSALSSVCSNDAAFTLTGGSPAGGTYSGTGVSAGSFNPAAAGNGTFVLTYSYTNGSGCSASDTSAITVNQSPTVTLGTFNNVCVNAAAFSLTGGSPGGGTYSGAGVVGTTFRPSQAGAGDHYIYYTYTSAQGCSATDSSAITVYALPAVTLPTFPSTCRNTPAFLLSGGIPAGGSYSGPGVSSNIFNPNVAGTGTHVIIYSYTDSLGCSASTANTITVNTPPTVTFGTLNAVCLNAAPFTLSGGSPSGGTYNGPGVTSNQFTASVAGAGLQTLSYTYTDSNSCSNSASGSIFVNALPTVTFASLPDRCVNAGPLALSGGSPAGGVYSGTAVGGTNFYPGIAGPGTFTITYSYTDSNSCTGSDTSAIRVNPAPLPNLGADTTVCADGSITLTAGTTFSTSVWSNGANTPSITIDTTGRGMGTFSFRLTVTNSFGCAGRDTIAVTFDICNGVSAPGQLDVLQVYPNPAQQELRINSAERIDVRWFDETGMLVRTDRLFAGTNRIAPGLPAGIYFLRFERDGLMQTIRVILLP